MTGQRSIRCGTARVTRGLRFASRCSVAVSLPQSLLHGCLLFMSRARFDILFSLSLFYSKSNVSRCFVVCYGDIFPEIQNARQTGAGERGGILHSVLFPDSYRFSWPIILDPGDDVRCSVDPRTGQEYGRTVHRTRSSEQDGMGGQRRTGNVDHCRR